MKELEQEMLIGIPEEKLNQWISKLKEELINKEEIIKEIEYYLIFKS